MTQYFTTAEDVFQWMDKLCARSIQPGLERMEWLLERLDHPEHRCKFIHIAGTNGKGSTAAMLSAVLQKAGYKVGLYVSPAVVTWNERIQINGEYIKDVSFVHWANQLKPWVEEMENHEVGLPSPFEFYTVLAICYFAYEACPWFIVWETGLGGRLDATNAVSPLVSVITRIGLDHQDWLGETLVEIAKEKAGIIKPGVPVICSQQLDEVAQVVKEKANICRSSLYLSGRDYTTQPLQSNSFLQKFSFSNVFGSHVSCSIPLMGSHQLENSATALMTLEILKNQYATMIEEAHIEQGLKNVIWPGRIEKVSENPIVLLDGAHNEDGMKVLVETIQKKFAYKKLFVMVGFMEDKDIEKLLSYLLPLVDKMVATKIPGQERSYSAEGLVEKIGKQKDIEVIPVHSPFIGIEQLEKWAGTEDLILITGSLYLVSEVRTYYAGKNE